MPWIDTHCHFNLTEYFPDPEPWIEKALAANVNQMIVIGIDRESSEKAIALADQYSPLFAAVGCHPNSAKEYTESDTKFYEELFNHPKCVAIGEIGLDYYWDKCPKDIQMKVMQAQIELAKSLDTTVIFHCREAYQDLINYATQNQLPTSVFHCFAGTPTQAKQANDLGIYAGVDGPITYKKADELREAIASFPIEKLVIETDAPFLTPHPYRGKPNDPSYLPIIGEKLAEIKGITTDQLQDQLRLNSYKLFPKLAQE
jgi:TatD DNase family protein